MGLYHDDIQVSTSLLSPPSTIFAILFLTAVVAEAWTMRRTTPYFGFAVAWFLLGHSIGGQLSGLCTGGNPDEVAALVFLTTTSVWWKSTPSLPRRLGALVMFSVFATVSRLLG